MKESTLDKLTQRQLQLVFTYALAGLGHLRVTDALYHGLPEVVNPVVLGSQDKSIQTIHRLTSIHPVGRRVFEWLQSGPLASWSNRLYRSALRSDTNLVYEEMTRLIDERFEPPKEVLVVSTHFGLAHKLAAIKEKIQREKRVKMILAVVVTDDTFQHIWYVDGADLIVVPSHFTQEQYIAYSRSLGGKERIEVLPYPVSPYLGRQLSARALTDKVGQLDAHGKEPINISIPISGAAVGTDKSLRLIEALREKSERFRFYVVSKDAPYTKTFLARISGRNWIDVHAASVDREVVDTYDALFEEHLISLEVTKPSEQAFKALFGTQSRGGVILLFSEPVGKQEFDNIAFLERHSLIPSRQTNSELWAMAAYNIQIDNETGSQFFDEAFTWRGVRLPGDAQQAAGFIWWMLTTGLFARMMTSNAHPTALNNHPDEVKADGVAQFWDLAISV